MLLSQPVKHGSADEKSTEKPTNQITQIATAINWRDILFIMGWLQPKGMW
jgi:hypothetical protein